MNSLYFQTPLLADKYSSEALLFYREKSVDYIASLMNETGLICLNLQERVITLFSYLIPYLSNIQSESNFLVAFCILSIIDPHSIPLSPSSIISNEPVTSSIRYDVYSFFLSHLSQKKEEQIQLHDALHTTLVQIMNSNISINNIPTTHMHVSDLVKHLSLTDNDEVLIRDLHLIMWQHEELMLVYPNKIKAHALLQVLHITNCTNVDLSSIVENAFLAQNYPSEWMSKLNDCTCEFLKIINQSIPTDEQSSTDFNAPQTVNEQWLMKGVDEEITVSCTDYQTSEEKWATKDLKEDQTKDQTPEKKRTWHQIKCASFLNDSVTKSKENMLLMTEESRGLLQSPFSTNSTEPIDCHQKPISFQVSHFNYSN